MRILTSLALALAIVGVAGAANVTQTQLLRLNTTSSSFSLNNPVNADTTSWFRPDARLSILLVLTANADPDTDSVKVRLFTGLRHGARIMSVPADSTTIMEAGRYLWEPTLPVTPLARITFSACADSVTSVAIDSVWMVTAP